MSNPGCRSEAELVTQCALEPIRIPGSIQPHGMLLAINERTFLVEHASENAAAHFPWVKGPMLGQSIGAIFGEPDAATLKLKIASRLVSPRPVLLGIVRSGDGSLFDILGHQRDGLVVLEMEPSPEDVLAVRQSPYEMTGVLDAMHAARSTEELFQATIRGLRRLTGFDKVMLYRFDPEWNGTVIAEVQNGTMEAFIGHRFPASDIPAQARDLYKLNTIRTTCNVDALPSVVVPMLNARIGSPLDMTFAALRSISPVHILYLKNMNVGASMSISIMRDGQLWGLIACHHRTPFYVPHHLRLAAQFLAETFSALLGEQTAAAEQRHRVNSQSLLAAITEGLTSASQIPAVLMARGDSLLKLTDSDGVVLVLDGHLWSAGKTPEIQDVKDFAHWLKVEAREGFFQSDWLPGEYEGAERFRSVGSGVLAVRLSAIRPEYLIWFREEQIQTVKWAGNPIKIETEDGMRISPRKSFKEWSEVVGMKARPWRPSELEMARSLREKLVDLVMLDAENAAGAR